MAALNRQFNIVLQPYRPHGYRNRRFLVTVNRLPFYLGAYNADTVVLKALACRGDKCRLRFRNFGIVDIYQK